MNRRFTQAVEDGLGIAIENEVIKTLGTIKNIEPFFLDVFGTVDVEAGLNKIFFIKEATFVSTNDIDPAEIEIFKTITSDPYVFRASVVGVEPNGTRRYETNNTYRNFFMYAASSSNIDFRTGWGYVITYEPYEPIPQP